MLETFKVSQGVSESVQASSPAGDRNMFTGMLEFRNLAELAYKWESPAGDKVCTKSEAPWDYLTSWFLIKSIIVAEI